MLLLLKIQAIGIILMTHIGLLWDTGLLQESTGDSSPAKSISELTQDTTLKARNQSRHVYKDNTSSTEISYEGTITFTEDEKDIKSISPGGYFKFSKTTF